MAPPALRHAAALAAFVGAAAFGRATVVEGTDTALVWPAAGVAVLWYLATSPATRWVTLTLVSTATLVVNLLTGSSLAVATVFVGTNVLQTALTSWLLERPWRDWPVVAWDVAFTAPAQLGRLLLATAVASVPVVVLGATGLWLVEDYYTGAAALAWWGRNGVGIVGVVASGLLLHRSWTLRDQRRPSSRARIAEAVALFALTGGLVVLDLLVTDSSFVYFLPAFAVWAGSRFRPTLVAVHSMLAGMGAIGIAMAGIGPFADVRSPHLATLGAQTFVGVVVVLGLVLTMAREQNVRLTADLRAARDESERHGRLLNAVLMSMQDGVVVVDRANVVVMVNKAAAQSLFVDYGGRPGMRLSDVEITDPDGTPLPTEERPSRKALAGRTSSMEVMVPIGDEMRRFAVRSMPLAPGLEGDAVLVFRDVTAERHEQAALIEFSSTVAHDLRNPLSAISMWTEMLEMSLGEEPAPEVQNALDRIRSGTARTLQLIDDLLTDAQARDARLSLQPVDLETLTRAALEQVPNADVRVLPIPKAMGDAVLLLRVMSN
ncbi:MAG: MASE1 domain-containing protein, partial [Nocardioides sp.]|nr:MASE1 domain-containing protein [Nocardioides sp.]